MDGGNPEYGPWKSFSPANAQFTPSSGVSPTSSLTPAKSTGLPKKNFFQNMFKGEGDTNMGQLMAGAGIPALAGMMQPAYEAPDFSGGFAKIQQAMDTNPYRNAAAQYLSRELSAPIGQDATAANAIAQRNSDLQMQENLRSGRLEFAAKNPGNDITNNSAMQDYQAKLLGYQNLNDQARNAQTQFLYDTQQRAQKTQQATELAAMGDDQINVLLAEMGITAQQAIAKAQYDAGRGQSMTDFASTIGAELFKRGLGTPQATVRT
jgi:hypothetical protein